MSKRLVGNKFGGFGQKLHVRFLVVFPDVIKSRGSMLLLLLIISGRDMLSYYVCETQGKEVVTTAWWEFP